jgi:hypothetical protein
MKDLPLRRVLPSCGLLLVLLSGCVSNPPASYPSGGLPPVTAPAPAPPATTPGVIPGQPVPALPPAGAPQPIPDVHPPLNSNLPRSIESSGSAAPVVSLVKAARGQVRASQLDAAGASLDRALRIEPRNPWVWQAQAQLHLAAQQAEQAESEARKSNSLGKRNPYLEAENWRIIAAARAQRGDANGAAEARARQDEAQQLIGNAVAP